MAKVTITLQDTADGRSVAVKLDTKPAFPTEGAGTMAQQMAIAMMSAAAERSRRVDVLDMATLKLDREPAE